VYVASFFSTDIQRVIGTYKRISRRCLKSVRLLLSGFEFRVASPLKIGFPQILFRKWFSTSLYRSVILHDCKCRVTFSSALIEEVHSFFSPQSLRVIFLCDFSFLWRISDRRTGGAFTFNDQCVSAHPARCREYLFYVAAVPKKRVPRFIFQYSWQPQSTALSTNSFIFPSADSTSLDYYYITQAQYISWGTMNAFFVCCKKRKRT